MPTVSGNPASAPTDVNRIIDSYASVGAVSGPQSRRARWPCSLGFVAVCRSLFGKRAEGGRVEEPRIAVALHEGVDLLLSLVERVAVRVRHSLVDELTGLSVQAYLEWKTGQVREYKRQCPRMQNTSGCGIHRTKVKPLDGMQGRSCPDMRAR